MAHTILLPAMALLLLTFVVWIYMGVQRLGFLFSNKIRPQKVATPEMMASVIPERLNLPANNLKNLSELPILFYFLCAAMLALGIKDELLTNFAWAFVALRAVHSAIHCTVNIVKYRFLAYVASSIALWLMAIRFGLLVF